MPVRILRLVGRSLLGILAAGSDRRAADIVLALAVGAATVVMSLSSIAEQREAGLTPQFYQRYFEPAVRLACGQPFGVDATGRISDAMREFLELRRATLSCDQVAPAVEIQTHPNTRIWWHLFNVTALYWKLTGVSWPALDGLAAGLLSIGAVALYLMLRLWMPLSVAAAATLLALQPAMPYLLHLRDLGKTPFILGALFVAAWLVTRSPPRPLMFAAMAAVGAWIGVGYGFRPDVLIALPLLAATAVLFRAGPLRREAPVGLAAAALMLVAFLAAASPIFSAFNERVGSCHWHFALLGLSDHHAAVLGAPHPDYSLLTHYDDLLTWRSVESYAERVLDMPATDYCTKAYDRASMALYLDSLATFPGDFLRRSLLVAREVVTFEWREPILGLQPSASWRTGVMWSWAAVVLVLLARDLRLGLFALFALGYLCAYPIVQFDRRHFFHLAFLGWIPFGLMLGTALRWRPAGGALAGTGPPWLTAPLPAGRAVALWRPPLRAAALMAAAGFAVLVVLQAAAAVQRHRSAALYAEYLAAPFEPAAREEVAAAPGRSAWRLDEPSHGPREIYGRMLRLDIGGPGCAADQLALELVVAGPDPDYRFTHARQIPLGGEGQRVAVYAPQYFSNRRGPLDHVLVVLDEAQRECLLSTSWIPEGALPTLWVTASLTSPVDRLTLLRRERQETAR